MEKKHILDCFSYPKKFLESFRYAENDPFTHVEEKHCMCACVNMPHTAKLAIADKTCPL